MSFTELNNFRNKEEVKGSIEKLNTTYAEKLTAYRE